MSAALDNCSFLCYVLPEVISMKILVTGFEPVYEKYDINPSWEAVKLLPNQINDAEIIKLELPCRYGTIGAILENALEKHRPDVLLSVGHAGRVNGLEVEWLGVNRDDCSLADNDGVVRQWTPICPDGADAYFTNLPVDHIIQAIHDSGVPAYKSYTAGQYLCNHALYLGRYWGQTKYPNLKSGFIHVPLCPRQAFSMPNAHTMEISEMARGLEAALHVLSAEQEARQ